MIMAGIDKVDVALSILKIAIVVGALLNVTPIMVWVERRGSALIQDRVGPNRVGPFGLFQSLADAAKFFLKEDIVPLGAHKWLYSLAPMFGLIPALTTIAVVPWGRPFPLRSGRIFEPIVADARGARPARPGRARGPDPERRPHGRGAGVHGARPDDGAPAPAAAGTGGPRRD